MIDEDVNLNTSGRTPYKQLSVLQSSIYLFLGEFREMLLNDSYPLMKNDPFSYSNSYTPTRLENNVPGLISEQSNHQGKSQFDKFDYMTSSYQFFQNQSNQIEDQQYLGVDQENHITEEKYHQKVNEITVYMEICSENKFEIKEDILIKILNFFFCHRPKSIQFAKEMNSRIAKCFEPYIQNILINELSYYEQGEDSQYAHLSQTPNLQSLQTTIFFEERISDQSNYQNDPILPSISPLKESNSIQKTTAFDVIQQETLWEYLCQYANFVYSQDNPEVKLPILQNIIFSTLQLCFLKFGAAEQYQKIKLSTLKLLEQTFLIDFIAKREIMEIEKHIFLRFLILTQFRNRKFQKDMLNRVIEFYKKEIPLFIERVFSMFCDDYHIQIIEFLGKCWSDIQDKELKVQLLETVLISTKSHIFNSESRAQFVQEIKEKLRLKQDESDLLFYPCISNDDFCVIYTTKEIESRIFELLRSKRSEQILSFEYYILKYILNPKMETNQKINNTLLITFQNKKDIHKRTLAILMIEMKGKANIDFCLDLLFAVFERIFKSKELQNSKFHLFFSFPKYLIKQLDRLEEQKDLQRIRASHNMRRKSFSLANRLIEDESLFQDSPSLQKNRFEKNVLQIQTKFSSNSTDKGQDRLSAPRMSLSSMNNSENYAEKIIFLLRIAFSVILKEEINIKIFKRLYFSVNTHRHLPFNNGDPPLLLFLNENGFFKILLQVVVKYKLAEKNPVLLQEISKIFGFLDQLPEKATSIQELEEGIENIQFFPGNIQSNVIDILISESLEQGELYFNLVEQIIINNNNNNKVDLPLLQKESSSQQRINNIENWERQLTGIQNIRVKLPDTFLLIFDLIEKGLLMRDTTITFLYSTIYFCKLEYNQVILSGCIGKILKIFKQSDDVKISKGLLSILKLLVMNMNVSTLSEIMKFFRVSNHSSPSCMEFASSKLIPLPVNSQMTLNQQFDTVFEESKAQQKNKFISILSLLEKMCDRNLQSVYLNNQNYLDFSKTSFVERKNLGNLYSNTNSSFSFIITFRLHEFINSRNNIDSSEQFIIKIESQVEKQQFSLEILIQKYHRDNYEICIRIVEQTNIDQSNNRNREKQEQRQVRESDTFKVNLEHSKWYLLGICYTNNPPNNNYQGGKFYLFLNGNQVFYSGTNLFNKVLPKVMNIDKLILGNDDSKKHGLQGQISNFFMSNSFMEGKDIFQMFQFYQEGRISNYTMLLNKIPFTIQLNVNAFQNKDLKTNQIVENGIEQQELLDQNSTNFFSKLMGQTKAQKGIKFLRVKAGGNVYFIQKMSFVETCLQVGNLEIFFYLIELITCNKSISTLSSNQILCKILQILSEYYSRYREYLEILEKQRLGDFKIDKFEQFINMNDYINHFLTKGGFLMFSQLLYKFIDAKGIDVDAFNCLVNFIETFKPEITLYHKGMIEVIFNMELWCLTNIKFQERVFKTVFNSIQQNSNFLTFLIEDNFFLKILLFQYQIISLSEVEVNEYMRRQLNEVVVLLLRKSAEISSKTKNIKSSNSFKNQFAKFCSQWILALKDEKTNYIRERWLCEYLDMFMNIFNQIELSRSNFYDLIFFRNDQLLDKNRQKDNSDSSKQANILQILLIMLQGLRTRKQSDVHISFVQSYCQDQDDMLQNILTSLKTILIKKEKISVKENEKKQLKLFHDDLHKILLILAEILICVDSCQYKFGLENSSNLNNSKQRQSAVSSRQHLEQERMSEQPQQTPNKSIRKDKKKEFFDIIDQCIYYDSKKMKLQLVVDILESYFEILQESAKQKLIRKLTSLQTFDICSSCKLFPDLIRVLDKIYLSNRKKFEEQSDDTDSYQYESISDFKKISARFLAFKFSTDINGFLSSLLQQDITDSDLTALLRFFDEGLKVILNDHLAEKYGGIITFSQGVNENESKPNLRNSQAELDYAIIIFVQFLEDFFVLKRTAIFKVVSAENCGAKIIDKNNTQNSKIEMDSSRSSDQSTQLEFSELFLKADQPSSLFLSIFSQCFYFLKKREIIYSSIPHLVKQKERMIKKFDKLDEMFATQNSKKQRNIFNQPPQRNQLTTSQAKEDQQKPEDIDTLGEKYDEIGQLKPKKIQIREGGMMRLIPRILFSFLNFSHFEAEFQDAVGLLQSFTFEMNFIEVDSQNVNLMENPFFSHSLCFIKNEDAVANKIKPYIFSSLITLIQERFQKRDESQMEISRRSSMFKEKRHLKKFTSLQKFKEKLAQMKEKCLQSQLHNPLHPSQLIERMSTIPEQESQSISYNFEFISGGTTSIVSNNSQGTTPFGRISSSSFKPFKEQSPFTDISSTYPRQTQLDGIYQEANCIEEEDQDDTSQPSTHKKKQNKEGRIKHVDDLINLINIDENLINSPRYSRSQLNNQSFGEEISNRININSKQIKESLFTDRQFANEENPDYENQGGIATPYLRSMIKENDFNSGGIAQSTGVIFNQNSHEVSFNNAGIMKVLACQNDSLIIENRFNDQNSIIKPKRLDLSPKYGQLSSVKQNFEGSQHPQFLLDQTQTETQFPEESSNYTFCSDSFSTLLPEIASCQGLQQILQFLRTFLFENVKKIIKRYKKTALILQFANNSAGSISDKYKEIQQGSFDEFSSPTKKKNQKVKLEKLKLETDLFYMSAQQMQDEQISQNYQTNELDLSNEISQTLIDEQHIEGLRKLEKLALIINPPSTQLVEQKQQQIYNQLFEFVCTCKQREMNMSHILKVFNHDAYNYIKIKNEMTDIQMYSLVKKKGSSEFSPLSKRNSLNSKIQQKSIVEQIDSHFFFLSSQILEMYKERNQEELKIQRQITSEWNQLAKNLVSQKGIWFKIKKETGEVFFKIRRYQDEHGRQFFIGVDTQKQDGHYTLQQSQKKKDIQQQNECYKPTQRIQSLQEIDDIESDQDDQYQIDHQDYLRNSSEQQQKHQQSPESPTLSLQNRKDSLKIGMIPSNLGIAGRHSTQNVSTERNQTRMLSGLLGSTTLFSADKTQVQLFTGMEVSDTFNTPRKIFERTGKKHRTLTELSIKKSLDSKYNPTKEQIQKSQISPFRKPLDQENKKTNNANQPKEPKITKGHEAAAAAQVGYKDVIFQRSGMPELPFQKSITIQQPRNLQSDTFLYKKKVGSLPNYSEFNCEYVTLKCSYYGKIYFAQEYLEFSSSDSISRPDEFELKLYGSQEESLIQKNIQKTIAFSDIISIHSRRFCMKEIAIEIFTSSSKSYYFNLFNPTQQNKFFSELDNIKVSIMNNRTIEIVKNREEHFKSKKYTEKWKKGELSNFEYLMLINIYASRSFNDITQYPIFPWIFNRYNNQDLDLKNSRHYRNLAKPIGALNEERLTSFQMRYEFSAQTSSHPYFYSSHYSSQAFIYNYLIRLEPFTSLHFDFMAKKFDCAQRQFYSIPNTWISVYENQNDLRELTPEFFYQSEFLKSKPFVKLGNLPNGKSINSVELPNWAKNPEHFISLHREGLESPYVSRQLGKWIDLIFGYKQKSAEDFNIFPSFTYEDCFKKSNEDNQQLWIEMKTSLLVGQCPSVLFKVPHEERQIPEIFKMYRSLTFEEQVVESTLKSHSIMYCSLVGKIIHIFDSNNCVNSLPVQDLLDSTTLMVHPSSQRSRHVNKFKFIQKETEFKIYGLSSNYSLVNIFISVAPQILVTGGFQDGSFCIYNNLREMKKVFYHKKPINILRFSEKYKILFCASEDLRISAWDVGKELKFDHLFYIYGHNSQISTVSLSDSLQIIFSSDKDRVCHFHSYQQKYMSSFVLRNIEFGDFAHLSVFSSDGQFIVIATTENKLQLYNVNGELLLNFNMNSVKSTQNMSFMNMINQIDIFQEYSIVISTSQGDIKILMNFHQYIFNKQEKFIEENDKNEFKQIEYPTEAKKDLIVGFFQYEDKETTFLIGLTRGGTFRIIKTNPIQVSDTLSFPRKQQSRLPNKN